MELVEGRTLRDAIAQGPMPIRQTWSIARQLAMVLPRPTPKASCTAI
jgi:hypothetical protein